MTQFTSFSLHADRPSPLCVRAVHPGALAENTVAVVQQKIASTAAGQGRRSEPVWFCSCGGRLLLQGGRWELVPVVALPSWGGHSSGNSSRRWSRSSF